MDSPKRQSQYARPSVRLFRAMLDRFLIPGGLFDVPPCPLDLDVGRRCCFRQPQFPYQRDNFTVVDIQLDCRGNLCYRVIGDHDVRGIGALAHPVNVRFIDEKPEFDGGVE
jgi:hypothetical protein